MSLHVECIPPNGTGTAANAVPFPSLEWFERLAERMKAERATHEHLGDVECVASFVVTDGCGAGPWGATVAFDGYEVADVRRSDPDDERVDFVLAGDLASWRRMIESIHEGGGRPPLDQTLNFLSLPGVPFRVDSPDPVRRDFYYRFDQSLQEFFNASHRFETSFPAEA
jgi:hypothetical protein